MRLINFGVGEITDRLSILSLKILHATEEAPHFATERAALLSKLSGRNLTGVWFDQALELSITNATIWRLEDDLRIHRGLKAVNQNHTLISEIAFRLQELNDHRHELIREINVKTGEHLGNEKGQHPIVDINEFMREQ